jgi:hypothetical protein
MIVPSVVSWEGVAATAVLIVLPAAVCTNAVVATVVELSLDAGVVEVRPPVTVVPVVELIVTPPAACCSTRLVGTFHVTLTVNPAPVSEVFPGAVVSATGLAGGVPIRASDESITTVVATPAETAVIV